MYNKWLKKTEKLNMDDKIMDFISLPSLTNQEN